MDILSSHKRTRVRDLIETILTSNPIEKAFSRLKTMLRKAGERTVSDLWSRIGKFVDLFQTQECANSFRYCRYDPD